MDFDENIVTENSATAAKNRQRMVRQKAAAMAFSQSFLIWAMVAMFTIDTHIRSEFIVATGMAGMTLLFVGYYLYYSKGKP